MPYRESSEWNDVNELRCLEVFQKLKEASFPHGMQIALCREMSRVTKLDVGNISAKVSNYKSVAGINNESNASTNTIKLYERFGQLSANETSVLIQKAMAGENVV